jgi:adenine-specific DNA-methyltransferase
MSTNDERKRRSRWRSRDRPTGSESDSICSCAAISTVGILAMRPQRESIGYGNTGSTTWLNSDCKNLQNIAQEEARQFLQARLDAAKTQAERNRLGQFATPLALAQEIVEFGLRLLEATCPIRFLDPAFGTGSFYSALLQTASRDRIETAKGFELDPHYGEPARELWKPTPLDLELADFTRASSPCKESNRFNLLICNPPYVRHHHIVNGDKPRLQDASQAACGVRIAGLAGLYCYFVGLSHLWIQRGGIAAWLIPSEFMDVNYGQQVKRYLLEKVTLLRIHRYDPNDVQFEDAFVSSAIVWYRNEVPPADHKVEFTFGGSLSTPHIARSIPVASLRNEAKWTRFPVSDVREKIARYRLSDFFTITRGIATGHNKFFILTKEAIEANELPFECFRPILPSPRYVPADEIDSDQQGRPLLDRQLFVLDCRFPEDVVRKRFPKLWTYLESGKRVVSERYLCRFRKVWYFQDERPPPPLLCTYLGRTNTKSGRPFRFILNHSKAIAANVYLLLYPKAVLDRAVSRDGAVLRKVWEVLNNLSPGAILGEGRVYGGGIHKLEPNELGNVDATPIVEFVPQLQRHARQLQSNLFDRESA